MKLTPHEYDYYQRLFRDEQIEPRPELAEAIRDYEVVKYSKTMSRLVIADKPQERKTFENLIDWANYTFPKHQAKQNLPKNWWDNLPGRKELINEIPCSFDQAARDHAGRPLGLVCRCPKHTVM